MLSAPRLLQLVRSFGVGEVSSEQWSSEQCTAVLLYCSTASSG